MEMALIVRNTNQKRLKWVTFTREYAIALTEKRQHSLPFLHPVSRQLQIHKLPQIGSLQSGVSAFFKALSLEVVNIDRKNRK